MRFLLNKIISLGTKEIFTQFKFLKYNCFQFLAYSKFFWGSAEQKFA